MVNSKHVGHGTVWTLIGKRFCRGVLYVSPVILSSFYISFSRLIDRDWGKFWFQLSLKVMFHQE